MPCAWVRLLVAYLVTHLEAWWESLLLFYSLLGLVVSFGSRCSYLFDLLSRFR